MLAKGFLINDKIEYEVIDGRNLKIIHKNLKINDTNLICGNTIIDLTSEIQVEINNKSHVYKINSFNKISNDVVEISTSKRTKSSFMMMPLISDRKCPAPNFGWGTFFINAYIGCNIYPHNGDRLFILYRSVDTESYRKLEKYLISRPNFIEIIDVDWYHTCFVFSFNYDPLIVDNFITGKYSQFPISYKKRILTFNCQDNESELADVLYKRESRRLFMEKEYNSQIDPKAELYSIPNMEEEILKIT
jgi:hypothetical protein